MAKKTQTILFTWENNDSFKMEYEFNDGGYKTIIEMEENGDLAKLWGNAHVLCEVFFKACLDKVGIDMAAP